MEYTRENFFVPNTIKNSHIKLKNKELGESTQENAVQHSRYNFSELRYQT